MTTIQCNELLLTLNADGFISGLTSTGGVNLLPPTVQAPFIQIGVGNTLFNPTALKATSNQLLFSFENSKEVLIEYTQKASYTNFCVKQIDSICEVIVFGPIPTTINATVGDVVGVVYDDTFAIGVQALNIKTIPGFPRRYSARALECFGSDKISSETSVGSLDYFCSTAYETDFGSVIQLFCENRTIDRMRVIDGIEIPVAPMAGADAKICGAEFALFGCKADQALPVIGEIELAEGLPHPMFNGEWGKTSRLAKKSYLITEFGVNDVDKMLGYAERGGFDRLYHAEPFTTWGHFALREDCFPAGDKSLKECCDKAAARGLKIGLHTLTSFTKTNDPYVTPVPDSRLAKVGSRQLASDITADTTDITVSDLSLFESASNLQTVQIGDELIRYAFAETQDGRYLLRDCTRGAFGTTACAHKNGEMVYRLWDHGYKVFFPDIELQDEFCDRLIELFNKTGVAVISFDGLEGCVYSGEDTYAFNRFCQRCFDGWKESPINDASGLHHNLWHMNTRMNWGEPWGEKMRAGMIDSRIKNQEFFRKNLFPCMFGWFLIRKADRKFEATTLDDIEWALSKAAGFDAGFGLTVSPSSLESLGNRETLLSAIKNWEDLRMADRFPKELKEKLKSPGTEWHLEKQGDTYKIYPVDKSQSFHCDLLEMQPGQPGGADWTFINPFEKQNYHCSVRIVGDGYVENMAITSKNGMLKFPARINGGEYLLFDGTVGRITDKNYNVIKEVTPVGVGVVSPGQQALSLYCDFGGNEGPEITLNMEIFGEAQIIA